MKIFEQSILFFVVSSGQIIISLNTTNSLQINKIIKIIILTTGQDFLQQQHGHEVINIAKENKIEIGI